MRGVEMAMFILCIGVAFMVLAGMGWWGYAGVEIDDGGMEEAVAETEEEVDEPGAGSFGPDEWSLASGATDTLSALWTLITNTSGVLIGWGVPGPIAYGVHSVVFVAFSLGLAFFIRGVTPS